MAKKRKAKNILGKVLSVGSVLIVVQLCIIYYFGQSTKPQDIRTVIDAKLDKTGGVSPQRKEQMRIQIAVNQYQAETGRLPASLEELKGKYFDEIPRDPNTGQPFKYTVEGKTFFVGEKKSPSTLTAVKTDSKPGEPQSAASLEVAADRQAALIASLDEGSSLVSYVYDPTGKRDPFRSFDLAPKQRGSGEGLTGYDIGQLRLTAVVGDVANIEDASGHGYLARKGTPIGLDGGEIVEVQKDRIKILETTVDFTGAKKTNVVEMELRPKDIQQKSSPNYSNAPTGARSTGDGARSRR